MDLRIQLPASLALLAIVLNGCASTSYEKAGTASVTISKAAQEIHKGNGQIDAVLFALTGLVNTPNADLKPQFTRFDSELRKLESLSDEVNDRCEDMQSQGADYFRDWDADLAKIKNENIRNSSSNRKDFVASRFERVRLNYVKTKAAFRPFLSDLQDIRTSLATDLTPGGVASIKSIANKAQANVTPLRESMTALESDFKALGVSLATSSRMR